MSSLEQITYSDKSTAKKKKKKRAESNTYDVYHHLAPFSLTARQTLCIEKQFYVYFMSTNKETLFLKREMILRRRVRRVKLQA